MTTIAVLTVIYFKQLCVFGCVRHLSEPGVSVTSASVTSVVSVTQSTLTMAPDPALSLPSRKISHSSPVYHLSLCKIFLFQHLILGSPLPN